MRSTQRREVQAEPEKALRWGLHRSGREKKNESLEPGLQGAKEKREPGFGLACCVLCTEEYE